MFKHLLDLKSLSRDEFQEIFQLAAGFLKNTINKNAVTDSLKGKIISNLFFENSTRTRNSFNIAGHRLGAIVVSPEMLSTALSKGESLMDTIYTFEAMGTSIFVIRHSENDAPAWVAERLHTSASVINAGDGTNQHPTQGLIDLFTMYQHKKDWESLSVAIVGDVLHSRVTHSAIDGLTTMGVKDIRLVGPESLCPKESPHSHVKIVHSLDEGIQNVDVIMGLRLQKERMGQKDIPDTKAFYQKFGLAQEKIKLAKPDAIVMHPGPINRNTEIAPEVADGPQSVILEQVRNGVAIRMAIMELLS